MNVSAPFIDRPIATALLMAGVLLVGSVAYYLLPVAPLPQVDFPTIVVTAQLPGTSADVMASSVATPLERQFAQMQGVTDLTSISGIGTTAITIQFSLNRPIDAAAQDVQSAIDAAAGQLPKNLPSPPTYKKTDPTNPPIMVLALHSDTLPAGVVADYADSVVAQQLSRVEGVGLVQVAGFKPAVRIEASPSALAGRGVSLEDVRSAVAAASLNAPKGTLTGTRQGYTVEDNDQLVDADGYRPLIIAWRNGSPVRLSDVATVSDGVENNLIWPTYNTRPIVGIIIQRAPNANVIDTVERLKAALPLARSAIPSAIDLAIVTDRTQTIRASVVDVQFTLVLTAALVVLVIFVFLRNLGATVIPGVAVPLSLIGTLAVMYVLGYSLDNLSLMALTIATGFVVDDAIVMVENITRHLESGASPREAAIKGAGEVGFTIVSMSISLTAVFIPMFLMSGLIGRLFREFAATVSIAVAVSAIVSLTLSPMMAAQLLRDERSRTHGRVSMLAESWFDRLLGVYDLGLRWVLRHRVITLAALGGAIVLTAYLYVIIPKGFFPQQDTGFIVGVSEAAQDISFPAMRDLQAQLIDIVDQDPGVDGVISAVGAGALANATANNGFLLINLKPRDQRDASATEIINRLRPKLAAVEGIGLFMQASQDINVGGRFSRTQFQYTLQDANLDELDHWAPILLRALQGIPLLRDVATDHQIAGPTLSLAINRDAAARLGVSTQAIDDTLYDAFGQRKIAQFFTQLNSYWVVLEADPAFQLDPNALDLIYVASATGRQVPLGALVTTTATVGSLSVSHQSQFPAITLSFNLAPRVALGQAVDAIAQAKKDLNAPDTLRATFQGNAQAFQASLKTQPLLILAAVIAVYIILGVLYESFIHPLTILSTIPSAGVGALGLLMMLHYELSVIAMIGIILLIGIVKKNAIMMIDFALRAERADGLRPEEAIYQAALLRFRPIMMTTVAALLGGVPLALGHGTGAEIRQPLGYAMVGGLLVSQFLTLFTTPVVYLALDRLRRRSGRSSAPMVPLLVLEGSGDRARYRGPQAAGRQ